MHHQREMLQAGPWGSSLGNDSAKNHFKIIGFHQAHARPLADGKIQKNPRKATKPRFPAVTGRILESIALHPGRRREARLYPTIAQLDYVVSGSARIGIIGQNGHEDIQSVSEGQVIFIPMGFGHWIENMSVKAPLLVLVLADEDE
jgi:hypothetical protein